MKKILLFSFSIFFASSLALAQNTVSGKVTDESGETLPGVNVVLKGTTTGTTTDLDGNFRLSVNESDILIFSYVGFEEQEVTVGSRTVIDVTLGGITELQEVIVVAYGSTTKESFTGAASTIGAAELEVRNVTSPIAALEGKMTGLQFTSPGGPGATPGIVIRGVGTLNGSTTPLYIVDGIQFTGPLNTINQEDIESFTVLKDAASTSLYGSRAANGVVIITTKKGRKTGGIKVNASAQVGRVTRSVPFYDQVSPGQYYETYWEALRNTDAAAGDPAFASANIFNQLGYNPFNVADDQIVGVDGNINPNADVIYQSLDWFEELQRTGVRSNYNVNISGGGEDHSVFLSTSYLSDESYVIRSGFERLTTRLNAEFDVTDRLKIGASANVALTETNGPSSAGSGSIVNPFSFAQNMGSIYPVFVNDRDGNLVRDAAGNRIYDNGEGYSDFGIGSRPRNQGRHSIQELTLNNEGDKDNSYGFRAFGDMKILEGLKLRVTYGGDFTDFSESEYENPVIGDAQPDGRLSQQRLRQSASTFNQVLTYQKDFNDHTIDLTAGHESYQREVSDLSGLATIQAAGGIFEFDNFSNIVRLTGSTFDRSLEGYFFRANYDYGNKYFLQASVRRDGSSVFDAGNRWGNFYSVGASWLLDQETFIQNIPFVSQLKLRASYGEVGNDNLGAATDYDWYLSQALFGITSNAASPAILIDAIGNADLKWETSANYDIALEFGLFDDFLEGSVEFYRRNSTDLLYFLPIAPSNGINEVAVNAGDMFNQGLELSLTAHLINDNDWKWDLTLLGTTFKNEITSLPAPFVNGSKRWTEGRSRFDFFLYNTAGVDPETGDQLYFQYDFDENNQSVPVLDAEGNHLTTTDWSETQRGYTGDSAVPDFLGSVSNRVSYKGFDLNVLVTYGVGGSVLDNAYAGLMQTSAYGRALHPDILNAWRQPGDVTNVPRLEAGNVDLVQSQSDRFITDASFVAIRNASLGYRFSPSVLEKLGLSSLRVSLTGENLFLSSERSGLDPQYNLAGTAPGDDFVPGRSVSLGLNLSF